jgi:tetratricopeptide (TPR) repeat protein
MLAVAATIVGFPVWLGATATAVLVVYWSSDPKRRFWPFEKWAPERVATLAGCAFACVEAGILLLLNKNSWLLVSTMLFLIILGTWCSSKAAKRVLEWRRNPDVAGRWISRTAASRVLFGASCIVLAFVAYGDVAATIAVVRESAARDAYRAIIRQGNAKFDEGEMTRAIQHFNEAIRLEPRAPDAWMNRGNAWQRQGRSDLAMQDYNESIRLNPQYAHAWYNRGVCRFKNGDFRGAIGDFDAAIRLKPEKSLLSASMDNREAAMKELRRIR